MVLLINHPIRSPERGAYSSGAPEALAAALASGEAPGAQIRMACQLIDCFHHAHARRILDLWVVIQYPRNRCGRDLGPTRDRFEIHRRFHSTGRRRAPGEVNSGVRFRSEMKATIAGGEMGNAGDRLDVTKADSLTLAIVSMAHEMGALFGGRLPHPPAFVPGGFTNSVRPDRISSFQAYLGILIPFI